MVPFDMLIVECGVVVGQSGPKRHIDSHTPPPFCSHFQLGRLVRHLPIIEAWASTCTRKGLFYLQFDYRISEERAVYSAVHRELL